MLCGAGRSPPDPRLRSLSADEVFGATRTRSGISPSTMVAGRGEVEINAPWNGIGSVEPKIVRKRERRFEGFDDKIHAGVNCICLCLVMTPPLDREFEWTTASTGESR